MLCTLTILKFLYSVASQARDLTLLRDTQRTKIANFQILSPKKNKCSAGTSRIVLHEYEIRFQFYSVIYVLQAFKVWPRAVTDDSGPKPPEVYFFGWCN